MLPLLGLYLFSALAWFFVRDHVPQGAVGLAVKAALWLIPAALYARQSAVAAFALGPPARGGLLRALLVGAAYLAAVSGLRYALGAPPRLAWPPLPAVLLTVANSVIEEAAFRGFLLTRLARRLSFWKANAVVGLGFVAVHVPTFVAGGAGPVEIAISCAVLFVFSLTLGEATRATRSIWPAVVIHSINNLLG